MPDIGIPQIDTFSPLPGYRFIIFLEGRTMGFRKVSGVSRQIETETYQEGGLNNMVHIFPKASAQECALHLEKGVYMNSTFHPFYLVGERINENLHLFVMNNAGLPMKSYVFSGITIKKWEVGDMDAQDSSLLIDSFELSYEEMDILM